MIIYHKNGEFSHIRLRIRKNRTHETWDIVPFTANVDEFFKDIEEIQMEY
jgi:hypothetical protein